MNSLSRGRLEHVSHLGKVRDLGLGKARFPVFLMLSVAVEFTVVNGTLVEVAVARSELRP